MNPLLASTALGLVAAWPVGVLGFGLGRLVERLTDDPRPRAAAWSLAYALPAGALAATVALTFMPTPAPRAPAAAPAAGQRVVATLDLSGGESVEPVWTPSPGLANGLAWTVVGLSAAGLMARGWRWNRGRRRLAKVRAASEPCRDFALIDAVRARAMRLGVKAPRVRISPAVGEPLLAGARHPVILLPQALAETADTRRLELVCGHELAHLRRKDNWRIPAEEALAGLFWLSPPVAALRGRMLAAREAVCDFTALDGAAPEARRDYARVLVDALRMNALPTPQSAFGSAFTGRDRSLASMRLSAILQPRGSASAVRVGLVFALGGVLTVATGAGSLALAAQARRLAPPPPAASAIEEAAAVAAVARMDAVAVEAPIAQAAPAAEAPPAPEMSARVAEVAEAAQAAPVAAPVAAARLSPMAAPLPPPPMAGLPPTSPLPPIVSASLSPRDIAGPNPSPNPNPHPNPRPNPNPQPNPQPKPDPESKLTGIEVMADQQVTVTAKNKTVFLGDVTVRGKLDPVKVVVKVDGKLAGPWFQPSDLRQGLIKRLEVTDARIGKAVVNVVLDDSRN